MFGVYVQHISNVNFLLNRLKDEQFMCQKLENLLIYVEKTGTSEEVCRAYLRIIEHLYYKVGTCVSVPSLCA
jgi:hypothetical protein